MQPTSISRVEIPKKIHLDLKKKISNKLKQYIVHSDDTLAEYVMVLLFNETSRKDFEVKISDFLKEDSESFAAWVWEIVFDQSHEDPTIK